MVEELSLGVEADELAPGPEAGIEGEEPLLTERRGEQKLAEVVGEDPDRLRVVPPETEAIALLDAMFVRGDGALAAGSSQSK